MSAFQQLGANGFPVDVASATPTLDTFFPDSVTVTAADPVKSTGKNNVLASELYGLGPGSQNQLGATLIFTLDQAANVSVLVNGTSQRTFNAFAGVSVIDLTNVPGQDVIFGFAQDVEIVVSRTGADATITKAKLMIYQR